MGDSPSGIFSIQLMLRRERGLTSSSGSGRCNRSDRNSIVIVMIVGSSGVMKRSNGLSVGVSVRPLQS